MNVTEFTNEKNWIGGYYELSTEFHPAGNDKRVNDALKALEKCHFFDGPWEKREDFQKEIISLPIQIEEDSVTSFYGTMTSSDGNTLPCLLSITRNDESDWLDISIPQAMFENLYLYDYPLTKERNPWLEIVDETFTLLAEAIYHVSPFDLAMIGEEISGYVNQGNITAESLKRMTFILPIELQNSLGVKGKGKKLSNQLVLYEV
ncbi:hypothetical protein [Alteribacter aurantiacus]|uniref:hypothetical protein n=1 Tax=Alteribacter aurantiacus TaxID=254410 RepID=UPI00041277D4|nr:hypothetical protein [Alteribacter aurantiacus]